MAHNPEDEEAKFLEQGKPPWLRVHTRYHRVIKRSQWVSDFKRSCQQQLSELSEALSRVRGTELQVDVSDLAVPSMPAKTRLRRPARPGGAGGSGGSSDDEQSGSHDEEEEEQPVLPGSRVAGTGVGLPHALHHTPAPGDPDIDLPHADTVRYWKQQHAAAMHLLKSVREGAAHDPATSTGAQRVAVHREQTTQPSPLAGEVVLSIAVYRSAPREQEIMQEFLVLGSTYLTQLRDKISCPLDRLLRSCAGDGHDAELEAGGYLFLEGTFYEDRRSPSGEGYVAPIIDFCKANHLDATANFMHLYPSASSTGARADTAHCMRCMDMADVRFADLCVVCSSSPIYLYGHLGGCEHRVQVSDIRMHHASDPGQQQAYPFLVYEDPDLTVKCGMCSRALATKLLVNDEMALSDPAYMCAECMAMLHSGIGSRAREPVPGANRPRVYDFQQGTEQQV